MIKPGQLIFDGYNFAHLFKVEDIDRPHMAEIDARVEEYDGIDGAVFFGVTQKPKYIDITVREIEPFRETMGIDAGFEYNRRLIDAHLFKKEPCKLILPDAPDLYEMAILYGKTEIDKQVYSRVSVLTFMCTSPASYGKVRHKRLTTGLVSMKVDGTYETAPVVKVEAAGPFTIYFDGKPFEVLGEVKGVVTIDGPSHLVTDESNFTVPYDNYADIPEWDPGKHTVYCDRPFTVKWQERWR